MRRITSRFVMLIATAAVAPLVIYGAVSIGSLREGTRNSVNQGNQRIADQAATQIKLYIDNNARILRSIAGELGGTDLAVWQQSRILKNHVLEFPSSARSRCSTPAGGSSPPAGRPRRHADPGRSRPDDGGRAGRAVFQ